MDDDGIRALAAEARPLPYESPPARISRFPYE